MNHIPGKFPPGSSKTRPRRRAEFSDDAVVWPARARHDRLPVLDLRRRSRFGPWSATDQAIACPCQVACGSVTRQRITSLVEWTVSGVDPGKVEPPGWQRNYARDTFATVSHVRVVTSLPNVFSSSTMKTGL